MNKPIKTAISSFGMSGLVFHGPSLKVNKKFEVLNILERTKNLSKELFPEAAIVRNFDDILNNPEIELVIVNTPDEFHYEMVTHALKAGKHVVVEKPITQKSGEASKLVELAKKMDVQLTVYQNRRWDGDFLTVQKVLKEGKLGRLVEFESHFDRYRTFITPDTWKEEGDEYAGVLFNLGSHMVDQAYVLFGKPLAVTAHLKIVRTGGKVTDYYDIRLEYKDFSALLKCSYLVKKEGPRYTLNGEYGTFFKSGIDPQEEILKTGVLPVGDDWGTELPEDWGTIFYEKDGEDIEELVETIPGDYNIFYSNLYDVLRKGANLLVKPEETVEVLKILEACLESDRKKRTIEL
jgi:predicted dehydrogenase